MTYLLIYFIIGLANVIWDWDMIAPQYSAMAKIYPAGNNKVFLAWTLFFMSLTWPIKLFWIIAGLFRR